MKSKATIGSHPLHPMLVPIPIGAFFLALVGDLMHLAIARDRFWYDFAYTCIGIGIGFAVLAALAGAIDYVGVKMSGKAFRIATAHAMLNVGIVACYLVSFLLRRDGKAFADPRWPFALGFSLLGFAMLAASGWLGGKLAHEYRVGVEEARDEGHEDGAVGARRASAAS